MEQQNTFWAAAQDAGVVLYLCPSRGRTPSLAVPSSDPLFPGVSFGDGGLSPWSTTDYAGNGYLLIDRWPAGGVPVAGQPLGISAVSDGLSNTILVGEKALDPRLLQRRELVLERTDLFRRQWGDRPVGSRHFPGRSGHPGPDELGLGPLRGRPVRVR